MTPRYNEPDAFNLVTVKVYVVKHETEAAILIVLSDNPFDFIRNQWIPKSQIAKHSTVQHHADSGELIIPKWLAVEKGLPLSLIHI